MIPISIVGHVKRAEHIERLAKEVDAEYVTSDLGTTGPSNNHIHAWEWLKDSDGRWAVCLEDDAIPVAGFRDQLSQALAVAPTPLVSLYLGRGRPPHWVPSLSQVFGALDRRVNPDAPDPCWLIANELLHCVGVALQTDLIPSMLERVKLRTSPLYPNRLPIDEAISTWAQDMSIKVCYTRPSIIQHRDGPSIIAEHVTRYKDTDHLTPRGHDIPGGKRVAWVLGTRKRWDSSFVEIPAPNVGIL